MKKLPALQTVKKNYAQALEYRTYLLANKSSKFDKTVLNYIDELVKKDKLQMKAHFFHKIDPISIIGFLLTSKLASDMNRIHEAALM